MRSPVKLFGFVVWLLSLHCGQCQETCLRDSITYQYVEPLPDVSYAHGKTVKVSCQTGFTGMYRLKCENGEWKEDIARPCQKKKCSHPGDAANGDFRLVDETEFVFGARVVYSCKKGFEMISRINQRTCRSNGWDNAVPVCEAVKCPAIHADEDVTATGNVEEGNYGDVIRFECVSPEKKIDGSRDIYCTETGEWSAPVPKCIVITCKAPTIQNGEVVDPEPIYPNNAQLKYRCFKRFKAREGVPKCASHGWTLNPECDAVTCELKSTFKVKSVNPEGKTIFRVGETVRITCTEEGWFSTKDVSKTFTCEDNGEWDSIPVCQEITCDRPLEQHVSNYYWRSMKLGEKKVYSCDKGYYNMETEATCTRDGLTPKPLCAEIVCPAPEIPNAEIVRGPKQKYILDSTVQYRCQTGFEPQDRVQIICKSPGQWMGIQRCTGKCKAPEIENGEIKRGASQSYSTDSTIQYECNPGFEPEGPIHITCEDRKWTGLRQCTAKSKKCQDLSVKNGFTDGQTPNKQEIFYSCDTGYKPFTGKWWSSVTCNKGSWPEDPLCILEEECGALPSIQNGKLNLKDKETAVVVCDQGFIMNQPSIKCINGIWEEPSCKVGKKCDIPPKVENALITSKPKVFYLEGYNVTYKCRSKFSLTGESTVFCSNGQWEETPTCVASKECDSPPKLENADIISKPETIYDDGSSITYACQSPFSLKGKSTVFCRDGKWEKTPTCEVQCPRPHQNSMKLIDKRNKDMYDNKEIVKYKCIEPYTEIEGGEWTCENGKWTGEFVCTSAICPPPPYVENGDFVSRNPADVVPTQVYYQCQAGYVLSEQRRNYKCEYGKWQTPPRCLKPCEITPRLFEEHNIKPIPQTTYIQHGQNSYIYCKDGFYVQSTGLYYFTMTCSDGKFNIELCQ